MSRMKVMKMIVLRIERTVEDRRTQKTTAMKERVTWNNINERVTRSHIYTTDAGGTANGDEAVLTPPAGADGPLNACGIVGEDSTLAVCTTISPVDPFWTA